MVEHHKIGIPKLLSPAELAVELGKSREWVYDHATDLGAIRIGTGPRPRLFFDPVQVRERLATSTAQPLPAREPKRQRMRSRKRDAAMVALLPIGRKR